MGQKLDSVGPCIPGVEVKISDSGEGPLRPGLFVGYYKAPEATNTALNDGWLATGDAGFVDPDSHGDHRSRQRCLASARWLGLRTTVLENRLKFSPYIMEAVAVGHARPYVAAMINIDLEVVGHWAEKCGIPYSSYADLAQKPEVYGLILQEIQQVNASLNVPLRIKQFVLLHKELDPDDAEITRTRKLRRRFVYDKYQEIIDAMYAEGVPEVKVRATVTYEDGRMSEIERSLKISAVGNGEA